MSTWLDKIKTGITFTLGDGRKFIPSWINPRKETAYNVSSFDFPNVEGTLVVRKLPMGRKFDMEIYFQGDDHLENAYAFEISANNPNYWKISHPYYDTIFVQPVSLVFDNSQYNVTKITGQLLETITDVKTKPNVYPLDIIEIKKENLDTQLPLSITGTVTPSDVSNISNVNTKNFNLAVPIVTLPDEFNSYKNIYNKTIIAVNNAIATPQLAMTNILAFINEPALFSTDIKIRLNCLSNQFKNLYDIFFKIDVNNNIIPLISSSGSKQIYQIMGGGFVSAMCSSFISPFTNGRVSSKQTVLNQINQITTTYNQYIAFLDLLQTPTGGNPNSFVPDFQSLTLLNDLVNVTITNLYGILFSSKTERSLILEKDYNLITLTHRLYGLDENDVNIDNLFAQNNWGLNQILQLNKGLEVKYYL